jgi:hypothetical protein
MMLSSDARLGIMQKIQHNPIHGPAVVVQLLRGSRLKNMCRMHNGLDYLLA